MTHALEQGAQGVGVFHAGGILKRQPQRVARQAMHLFVERDLDRGLAVRVDDGNFKIACLHGRYSPDYKTIAWYKFSRAVKKKA